MPLIFFKWNRIYIYIYIYNFILFYSIIERWEIWILDDSVRNSYFNWFDFGSLLFWSGLQWPFEKLPNPFWSKTFSWHTQLKRIILPKMTIFSKSPHKYQIFLVFTKEKPLSLSLSLIQLDFNWILNFVSCVSSNFNFCAKWIIECKNRRVQIQLDSKLDFNWSSILRHVFI